jgi:hypothetical protein
MRPGVTPQGRRAAVAGVLLALAVVPRVAGAQTYPRSRSLEVGGSATWVGASSIGSARATETSNQPGASERLTLFETEGSLRAAAGVDTRIGFNLTPNVGIEAALTFSRPVIATSVTNDFEGAPNTTIATSHLDQYFVDVGVVLHLTGLRFGRGTLPFGTASVGYLRQLTADPAVAFTGRVYELGGGLKQMLTAGRRVGARFDARLGLRDGGFDLAASSRRAFFAAGAGLFVAF